MIYRIHLTTLLILAWLTLIGKENPKQIVNTQIQNQLFTECVRPIAQIELKANNVRARLSTNANFFSVGQYFFPKPATGKVPVSSIYVSSLWMGGLDRSRNIKLSAGLSQFDGSDYFAGPLDLNGLTEAEICINWDKMFSVNGDVIKKHYNDIQSAIINGIPYNCGEIPDQIKYWPGQGNPYWNEKYDWLLPDQPLAPFWDENSDGHYDPCVGDFPTLDIDGCEPLNAIAALSRVPTEHIFYIFNDHGGLPLLSGPAATIMETRVSSFAYSTNDDLNNVTFHQYKFQFKGNELLTDFYFGLYVDPDLGCYYDDFVGYEQDQRMAYVYNQDALDGIEGGTTCEGTNTYADEIPMLGFDVHKNINVPKRFKRDNNGKVVLDNEGNILLENPDYVNSQIDTVVEAQIGSFIHIENGGIGNPPPSTTEPQRGREDGFYNYLNGFWSDGTPLTFGGTGYNPGSTDSVRYAFPDIPSNSTGWSMCNVPAMNGGDRKFLMSSEVSTIFPGMITSMVLGIVGVLDVVHPCPDLTALKFADVKAQNLFDKCFQTISNTEANKYSSFEENNTFIYPNPTSIKSGDLNIANLPENAEVRILDFYGNILFHFLNNDGRNTSLLGPYHSSKVFDIPNNIKSGLYFVNILTNNRTTSTLKWIVVD